MTWRSGILASRKRQRPEIVIEPSTGLKLRAAFGSFRLAISFKQALSTRCFVFRTL